MIEALDDESETEDSSDDDEEIDDPDYHGEKGEEADLALRPTRKRSPPGRSHTCTHTVTHTTHTDILAHTHANKLYTIPMGANRANDFSQTQLLSTSCRAHRVTPLGGQPHSRAGRCVWCVGAHA